MTLSEKSCQPCTGKTPPLDHDKVSELITQIPGWTNENDAKISKSFKFENFKQAMDFAGKVAVIADKENHHPDLIVRWGELRVEIWTHASKGLTENDFILAAKIDKAAA
ncbi:MAG TPA: 4a-hydroxytetrahydrobiopterin dehydratase [Drouetiella sp.]